MWGIRYDVMIESELEETQLTLVHPKGSLNSRGGGSSRPNRLQVQ